MRLTPGKYHSAPHHVRLYRSLSFILSTALVILPVLPARAALARAASGARPGGAASALRAAPAPAALPLAPSLSATKVDAFSDPDGDGKAEPGQTITYTVTVTNNGTDATNVNFADTIDANTTLVPGSVATQPVAANDSYNVLGNVRIQPNAAAGLLANDCDPDNGGTCSSSGLTASGPTTSAQGGNVTVNADGSFSYNPPAGYEGPDSFNYTVSDGTHTDTATANFTVNEMVWFIDNTAPAGGDGRLTSPYNSLASVSSASDLDEPFDFIFVHEGAGAYAGGILLEDNQRLIGQGTGLDAALALFGVSAPAHSDARPAATSRPVLGNAAGHVITLANNNAVLHLDAAAAAAASSAVFGSATGGASLSNVGASATGGAGGLSLVNYAGTFSMANSTVTANSTAAAVNVSGGATPISFSDTDVSQSGGGRVVDIQSRTGGLVSFDAASSVAGTNGTTDAVSLLGNTGATVTFAGPVQLNTNAAGARGLVADSGTVNLTNGGNAVSSTGAAAVDIENLAANISFATTFSTNSTGHGLSVDNVSGSASFGNTAVNNSSDTGVLLTDNSAALVFTDLDIAPAANVRALHATSNAGAITSTSGTVITTGAIAVQIAGTSSASRTPLNVQLTSVSADGGNTLASGLILTNTSAAGSPGGFRVNGLGTTDASGGTIQKTTTRGADINNAASVVLKNMDFTSANSTVDAGGVGVCDDLNIAGCNAAVYLNGVNGAALDNVNITGTTVENGITAVGVADFKLDNSLLDGCGDATNEGCVEAQNLSGTSTVNGTEIRFTETNSFDVVNTDTNWNLTISGSTFRDTQTVSSGGPASLNGEGGLQFRAFSVAAGSPVTTINVLNSSFLRLRAQGIQASAADDAILNIDITGNTIDAQTGIGTGIDLNSNNTAQVNFNILNNPTIQSRGGSAVNVTSFLASHTEGRINNNPDIEVLGGAGIAVRLAAQETSEMIVEVNGNTVSNVGGTESTVIDVLSRFQTARLDATITNNTVSVRTTGIAAINLTSGASAAGESNVTCGDVANNTTNAAGISARAFRIRVSDVASANRLYLEGFVEAGTALQDTEATWNGRSNLPVSAAGSEVAASLTGTAVGPLAPPGGQCQSVDTSSDFTSLPFNFEGTPSPAFETAGAGARPAADAAAVPAFGGDATYVAASLRKDRRGLANSERGQALSLGSVTGFTQPATLKAAAATAPAAFAGETINVPIGTLKAGDSVTITFQVTVADPFPTNVNPAQVSNQGTVTADGGVSVLTDDPSEGGGSDPTVTPILTPPAVSINDATVAEPASGSADMLFTVTLSHGYTQAVAVNYQTANGGANPATAGTDYTTSSGSVSFAAGETVKTVAVPVLADGTAAEGDEHFLVSLSAPTNSTIGDGQATGTITDESVASPVIISELRTSGPGGTNNDFVELLNTTDADITVASTDGSSGWSIVKSGAGCSDTPVVVGVVPNGTVIPARGNYLLVGSGYSLGAYAAGDAALSADIEDDRNVGLFTVANLANISSVNRYDAVGFGTNTGDNCDLLREGNNLPAAAGSTDEHSFVRKVEKGKTQDTTDNAADFVLVSTDGGLVNATPSTLGAPGPENSSSPSGPVPCSEATGSAHFGRDLIDPAVATGSAPNTVRNSTAVTNGTFGTLDFRRTFTNNTGANVTRLRFRITDLSTKLAVPGTADLRALSSSAIVVSTTSGNKTVAGTTVETPPAQALGGGVNSSLAAGTVTLGSPLAPGGSVNLRFLFGVEQTGDYDIAFVLESLPGSGKDIWKLSGHTESGGHADGGCNKAPVANAGADITAECDGGEAAVTLDGSASTDPDGDTPLTYEWKEGTTVLGTTQTLNVSLSTGSHTVTLTVTDPSGDSSQDTVVVNVVDTEAPEVTAPADVTAYTGPGATSCGADVSNLGTATAEDDCEGSLAVTATRSDNQPLNAPYPVGTTVVTWKATDGAGHTGSDTQNVIVVDNTPPTVTAPDDITAPADPNSCSAMVNPGTASASDNCAVQSTNGTRSDNQPLNAPYPVGTTTITWKATDVNGNTATDTQTVTVQDTQPPTVTSSVAVTTMGPPFNHALINVGLSATASDNCGPVGPLQVFVYSDEDDGPAPHSPDATNIGLSTLKLRRERDGGSNGRVYLIVVRATDASGNTSVSVTTVTVPLSSSAGDQASVNAQAAAAAAYAAANNGAAPAGYFVVGP